MKPKELLEIIGEAQDDYILDAKAPSKKYAPVWVRWVAIAACFALVTGLAFSIPVLTGYSQRYKRIHFDENALGESLTKYFDEKTEVLITTTETFPTQIPIYQISERKITNKELHKMKQQFGIPDSAPGQIIDLGGNELYGTLVSYTDTSRGYFDMTDEELEKAAWEAFVKLPFMEGTFQYLGIIAKMELTDSTGTHVTRVGVSFRRILDDIRVLGDEICNLYFDGSGFVEFDIKLYTYKEIGTMDVVPFDEAFAKIKYPDRLSFGDEASMQNFEIADTMQVNDVMLLLINQHLNGCTILQPVYSFMGNAEDAKGMQSEFNAWVIAIPESYTYE